MTEISSIAASSCASTESVCDVPPAAVEFPDRCKAPRTPLSVLLKDRLSNGLPVSAQWAKDLNYTANAYYVAMHRIRKAKQ